MGEFVIKTWMKIAAWIIAIVIVSLNVKLVLQEITGWLEAPEKMHGLFGSRLYPFVSRLVHCCYTLLSNLLLKNEGLNGMQKFHMALQSRLIYPLSPAITVLPLRLTSAISTTKLYEVPLAQGGLNARYLLLHVVETAGAMVYGSDIEDQESARGHACPGKLSKQLEDMGYNVEIKIGFGNPKSRIPKMVKEFQADLAGDGCHGHKFFKDLIFGTTVDTVRHRVGIPVLIVREFEKTG